ncbi:MAG: hypothetical protein ACYSUV_19570 [Planctomycetota bacterium]|jgi:hypothetical protein
MKYLNKSFSVRAGSTKISDEDWERAMRPREAVNEDERVTGLTVRQVIEILQKFPADLECVMATPGGEYDCAPLDEIAVEGIEWLYQDSLEPVNRRFVLFGEI